MNRQDAQERQDLLLKVDALERAKGKKTFLTAYQAFVAAAANHMTLIGPFVPQLTGLLK